MAALDGVHAEAATLVEGDVVQRGVRSPDYETASVCRELGDELTEDLAPMSLATFVLHNGDVQDLAREPGSPSDHGRPDHVAVAPRGVRRVGGVVKRGANQLVVLLRVPQDVDELVDVCGGY